MSTPTAQTDAPPVRSCRAGLLLRVLAAGLCQAEAELPNLPWMPRVPDIPHDIDGTPRSDPTLPGAAGGSSG